MLENNWEFYINSLVDLEIINYTNVLFINEDVVDSWIIDSIIKFHKINIQTSLSQTNINDWNYSIQTIILNGKKYFRLEKIELVNKNEKEIVLNLLEEEFWQSLLSVWIFWSYITKENWEYSDYDLVIMLDHYSDSNIYEREKISPKLKAKLRTIWIKSLFAFNFTTKEELENANKNNPWLLETMWKSFHILKDKNNDLEKILTKNRWIKYLWNFVWEWNILNTKENLDRIEKVLNDYKKILSIARKNNDTDFITHYKWEIKKLEITRQLLEEQSLFVSRFDFDFICKELLNLDKNKLDNLFQLYKKASVNWKKSIQSYNSVVNNIDFSESLKNNNLILPSLQHRYIALRNILSEMLHKTWNFILDWEFTQKFLQIFWEKLPKNILNIFYEQVFKTEQILWRTWYLSFDLNSDWSYIFEYWNYDYKLLIDTIDTLIKYFQENNIKLLNEVWKKETKISIIVWNKNSNNIDFLFPNDFKVYNRWELKTWNYPKYLQESEFIFILNSDNEFSPDFLLKTLWGFNKSWIKCISWNRVSKTKWVENKFHNFVFRRKDYEKEWKEIFKSSFRNVWTNYFTF